jgi:hypothetical protein
MYPRRWKWIPTLHLLYSVWNAYEISATEMWNCHYMLPHSLECPDRSLYPAEHFCVPGKWSSWAKRTPSRKIVAWTCGTKWREVVIVKRYVEVLPYTVHRFHDLHGVCCCLPIPRTCKLKSHTFKFLNISLLFFFFRLSLTNWSSSLWLGKLRSYNLSFSLVGSTAVLLGFGILFSFPNPIHS